MLNTRLMHRAMDSLPKLNPQLCNGYAYHQANLFESYIDEVIRCASQSFPPGLVYVGPRRATPEEQFRDITRYYRKKRTYEISPSDLYHRAYEFEFNGERLPTRYIRLPIIRRGGLIRIRGSSFTVSPALEDNNFSVTADKIFMPITRAKLNFRKISASVIRDGQHILSDVVHSPIYNIKEGGHKQRVCLLAHYILARFGFTEALKKYYDIEAVVGGDEIDAEKYPQADWIIYRSLGEPPTHKGFSNYIPSALRVAIRRDDFNTNVESFIAGLFYIADHEPRMVTPDHLDNPAFWQRILPRFIKVDAGNEVKNIDEMKAHFESLDSYVDDIVRRRLQKENIPCNDIYDVFDHIMKTFTTRTMTCVPADMIDRKRLDTVRPLMADVVSCISKLTFDLVKMQGSRLTKDNINRAFDWGFPTNVIKKINRQHGEVSTLESATDCLPLAVTKQLIPQAKATATKKSNTDSEMTDPAYALHSSQTVVSTYYFITKSDPSGRSSINHFLEVSDTGEVMTVESLKKELADLDEMVMIR